MHFTRFITFIHFLKNEKDQKPCCTQTQPATAAHSWARCSGTVCPHVTVGTPPLTGGFSPMARSLAMRMTRTCPP